MHLNGIYSRIHVGKASLTSEFKFFMLHWAALWFIVTDPTVLMFSHICEKKVLRLICIKLSDSVKPSQWQKSCKVSPWGTSGPLFLQHIDTGSRPFGCQVLILLMLCVNVPKCVLKTVRYLTSQTVFSRWSGTLSAGLVWMCRCIMYRHAKLDDYYCNWTISS